MNRLQKIMYTFLLLCGILTCIAIYKDKVPETALVETPYFQEVPYTIGSKFPLDGILTLPREVEQPPVLLLIQGSGQSDKNETIYQNTPFQDIAHGLAQQGIATLRYDKRFYVYLDEANRLGADLTMEEEILEDVAYALELLQNDPQVGDIFVLGHSLGGMLTPVIAQRHPFIQGIISMAGSPYPLYELSYRQNKEIESTLSESNLTPEELSYIEKQFQGIEADILTLRGDFSHLSNEEVLLGLPVGYQQSAKELAGEHYLPDLNHPMLILQGGADFQATIEDFQGYQSLLKDKTEVTFHWYEGLNHLMMLSSGARDTSDYLSKQEVSPLVLEDIAKFIQQYGSIS